MLGQQPQLRAQEPTTDGIIALLSGLDLRDRRVGVQLYLDAGDRLLAFLAGAGAVPDPVTPYEYASRAADETILALIDQLAAGSIDVMALTSAPQVRRLFHVAQSHGLTEPLLAGLGRTTIAAIGPVVVDAVRQRGLSPAIMPRRAYFMKPLVVGDHCSNERRDQLKVAPIRFCAPCRYLAHQGQPQRPFPVTGNRSIFRLPWVLGRRRPQRAMPSVPSMTVFGALVQELRICLTFCSAALSITGK